MKKLVVGCWLVGLRLLLAQSVVGALAAGVARAAELPAGYMAVDYIVASKGAYIDTGYKPNQNSCTMMDVTVQGASEYWFGCWDRNYNDGAFAFGNDGSGIYAGYGNQGGTFGNVVANGRHAVELNQNVVKVDGGAGKCVYQRNLRARQRPLPLCAESQRDGLRWWFAGLDRLLRVQNLDERRERRNARSQLRPGADEGRAKDRRLVRHGVG